MTLAIGVLALSSGVLQASDVTLDGRAWLNAQTDPAGSNVSGDWFAGEWGTIGLKQAEGSRELTGQGDGHLITGVVSGAKLFLLFSDRGKIVYSAELSVVSQQVISGRYWEGLSSNERTRLLHLTRVDANTLAAAPKDPARVFVYREAASLRGFVKLSLYCDGQEVALVYSGSYFTLTLRPGEHWISSSDETAAVALDARPGGTYYVRVSLNEKGSGFRTAFAVAQVDKSTASEKLKRLKPAATEHVIKAETVSAELPPDLRP